jgi:acetyltransferase-like isoleucine patch superfamily enzyme
MRALSRRARRRWFIVRLRIGAWLMRSPVEIDIHPMADIARDITLEIRARTPVRVIIGRDVEIQTGLKLRLAGTLEVHPRTQLRYDTVLNINGHLLFEGRNIIGRNGSIHADGLLRFCWGACLSEYVTVVDSDHGNDGSVLHMHDQSVAQADIVLGPSSFVAAQSIVTAGAKIGAGSVVGANSVVTRDIPEGVIAVGAPAKAMRTFPRAWSLLADVPQDASWDADRDRVVG